MKRFILAGIFSFVLFVLPLSLMAADYASQGDALYNKGGLEDYKKSIGLHLRALEEGHDSYEANWKLARSCRMYGEHAKRQVVQGWKDICAEYGKMGMNYGEKAIGSNPDGVEGHYYYGLNAGIYSDGVSIITAIRQGLKGKTQSSFEKAYEINKRYDEGGPMTALGRFWFVLPWPLSDNKKSLKCLRESHKAFPENVETQLYLGESLLKSNKKEDKAEAKALLQKVAGSDERYFSDWAKRLLVDNK